MEVIANLKDKIEDLNQNVLPERCEDSGILRSRTLGESEVQRL